MSKREGVLCSMLFYVQCLLTPAAYDRDEAMALAFYYSRTYIILERTCQFISEKMAPLASVIQTTLEYSLNPLSTRKPCSLATKACS